jgi:hypothetical protein
MRMKLALVLVAACSGKTPATDDAASTIDGPPMVPCFADPEALPAPHCGQGTCSCCVSCPISGGLCFGSAAGISVGIGQCVASPVAGSLDMMIGSAAFSATQVAGAVVVGYIEVSGTTDTQSLTLALPATPGTYSCSDPSQAMQMTYVDPTGTYRNQAGRARPACTVTVTSVGEVDQRIEGTFSVTMTTGSATLDLTNGAFSVERVPYP